VPGVRGRRHADRRTGGIGRHVGPGLPAVPSGDVDVAPDDPAVARGRLRALPHQVRTSERQRRSDSGDRTRRHDSGVDLPVRRLAAEPHHHAALARLGVLRHRRAQHEGRIRGPVHLHGRRYLLPVPGPRLSLQQRCAEPVDHAAESAAEQRPCEGNSTVRPGSVERRAVIAAGRPPLRSRVEL
jgi:hypothetical protein